MNKISACIVAYNEQDNIRKCLQSLKGVVDEIIFVHDGECSDRTLEIANEYGAQIFVRPHIGIMEAHLVFAIKKSSGDWVIRVDSDEFLATGLRAHIRRLVAEKDIAAYSFVWRDFDESTKHFKNKPDRKIILFRKKELYWISLPHFAWQSRGRIRDTDYVLGHSIRLEAGINWLQKQKKWAKIQARSLLKDFDELDNFQATREDWHSTYVLSRRFSNNILSVPAKFIFSFVKGLFFKKVGWSKSYKRAIYNFYLAYYLFKYSHKH